MKIFLAMLALISSPIWAGDPWTSQQKDSQLQFIVRYEGQEVVGVFHAFQVKFAFDPADLNAASLEVLVDINSADLDSDDLNSEILKPDWFAAAQFPQARFFSDSIRANGGDTFIAEGTLRLKGIEKTFQLPFTWSTDDAQAFMQGEVALQRTDFSIGSGEWASGDTIDTTVKVHYQVMLQ